MQEVFSNNQSKSEEGGRYDSRGNLKVELQDLLITLGNDIIINDIDDMKLRLTNLIESTRKKYSGDSYIKSLEFKAVNYTERAISLIAAIKYLATNSSAKDRYTPNQLINKVTGVASSKCDSHLRYLTSDCQGCANHKHHNRYVELKEIRDSGNIDLYIDELEYWTTLYFFNSEIFISIVEALYTNIAFDDLPKNFTESEVDRQARKAMKIIGGNAVDTVPPYSPQENKDDDTRKYNDMFYRTANQIINSSKLATLGTEARIELLRLEEKYSDISRLLTSIMEENHFNGLVRQFTDTILSNFDSESNAIEESEVIYAINSIEDSVIKSSNIYREGIPVLVSVLTGANEHIHPYFRSMLTDEFGDYSSSAMEDITFKYNISFNSKYHDFLDADKESVGEALSLVANAFTYMTQEPVEYRKELSSIYASEDNYILPDHRCLRTERFYMLWDIKNNQSLENYLLALFSAELSQFKIEYLCWKLSEKISENKAIHNSYNKSYIDPYQMILDLENLIYLSCLAFNEGNMKQKQHNNSTVTE